jgi:hypothetical protein
MSQKRPNVWRQGAAIAIAALVLWLGSPAFAQVTTGTIAGKVTDSQGGAMPGVVVTVTSESRNTLLATVTTDASGDFVAPNVTADTYTIDATMSGFKPVKRTGVSVSGGQRVVLQTLTLEIGGLDETVQVVAEAALLQAQSGERSFTVTSTDLTNLPVSGRNFASYAALVPGVSGTQRIGGGGTNAVSIDGVASIDAGNNAQLLQLNTDAIAEVRVLTSGYQAEFGRNAGVQITAVTKSGTNRFRGSAYEIMERSDWNTVSWANQLNGTTPGVSNQDTFGFTLGGPVGRPGGNNKLFFFYGHEFRPSSSGGTTQRVRLPTNDELNGDFRRSTDNNGNLITLKAPYSNGLLPTDANCGSAAAPMPCRNILAWWKNTVGAEPNISQDRVIAEKLNYNYETTSAVLDSLLQQPMFRADYQFSPDLRVSGRYAGQDATVQVTPGPVLPGFNDTLQPSRSIHQYGVTVNYTINPTMFLEATYGGGSNYLGAFPVTPYSDRRHPATGMANFPLLFNQNGIPMGPGQNRDVVAASDVPWLEDNKIYLPPLFYFGSLIGPSSNQAPGNPNPPSINYPEFITESNTREFVVSLTKVAGRHTFKSGFYWYNSLKPQNRGGPSANPAVTTGDQQAFHGRVNFQQDASNPLDTGFGYANAMLGIFSTYNQQSQFVFGDFVTNNIEGYLQDNWRVTNRLTLDYGVRIVHQQPQYDRQVQSSNFFVDKWALSQAPALYESGCAVAQNPCPQNQRQAKNPETGALLGPGTAFAIGSVVIGSGDDSNGVRLAGTDGNNKYNYTWPSVAWAPRTGFAYDLMGDQRVVLRGGYGLFFDRPSANTVLNQIGNPPFVQSPVLRWSTLNNVAENGLGSGLVTQGVGHLTTFQYDAPIPKSAQWNAGVQMALPWASSLDVSYVGMRAWDMFRDVDINSINYGAAFLPENQDPTLAPAPNGANAVVEDLMRPYVGLGRIQQNTGDNWSSFHSIQLSFQRRFRSGFSFGVNDTWALRNRSAVANRLEHYVEGDSVLYRQRADLAAAEELDSVNTIATHQLRANAVWDLPDYRSTTTVGRVIGAIVNDWQTSGILTASTGTPYSVGYSYNSAGSNINITGSPQYGGRIYLLDTGNLGSGCSSNQYAQFNNSVSAVNGGVVSGAFRAPTGPATVPAGVSVTGAAYSDGPSVGLESAPGHLKGCASAIFDMSLARQFHLGSGRTAEFRVEAFNLFDTVVFTGRNATLALNTPTNPTMRAPQYTADGSLVETRLRPQDAGFGAVTGAAPLRTLRVQFRFSF